MNRMRKHSVDLGSGGSMPPFLACEHLHFSPLAAIASQALNKAADISGISAFDEVAYRTCCKSCRTFVRVELLVEYNGKKVQKVCWLESTIEKRGGLSVPYSISNGRTSVDSTRTNVNGIL